MRLKENSSSYRASGVRRRNARQDKPPDAHRPVSGKKDTRRWCKGIVGREHKPECMNYAKLAGRVTSLSAEWRILACSVCGKELDHYYPWPDIPLRKPKPAWVTF